MIQKMQSLIEQLYETSGKAEIVDGEIVHMSPAGIRHSRGSGAIYASLLQHEQQVGGGYAFPDNAGFIVDLAGRTSFSPDAAWYAGTLDESDMNFVNGAPTFAVEIRSKWDYGPAAESRIRAKIADYLAGGTLVVWDVDLQGDDVIKCYRANMPGQVQVFRRSELADAEPAIFGWKFPVDRLLP